MSDGTGRVTSLSWPESDRSSQRQGVLVGAASRRSFLSRQMTQPSPKDLLDFALDISAAAQSIPMRYFRSNVAVEDKPDESPVTIADRETEQHIRSAIQERFPSHGIFGEEFGASRSDGDTTWIVDPIDGTRSFIAGIPLFGMLLGAMVNGEMVAGIIRMPALGEVFAGCRGGGATMNGKPVRCRPSPGLDRASLCINDANRLLRRELPLLQRLASVGRLRRFTTDCYPFGLLAMGMIDAVVDSDLQPYDYLPVVPVIEAAGGIITDWGGNRLGLKSDGNVLAAGSAEMHREMLKVISG
jgi:histidinol phosphatase-like enzyme (inositol monophosphatase family)